MSVFIILRSLTALDYTFSLTHYRKVDNLYSVSVTSRGRGHGESKQKTTC